jgi:hypothetical protein|tara:strand:- start:7 stop:651 length:645 start_codon:yes stop_codon:yes gene_type:complete
MKRAILAGFLVLLLCPFASAETYRISGKATYADSTPVSLDYVYVECEVGAYECYQYRGTKAMTDAYGDFTVVIDAGDEEDGIDILLSLRGENFTHIIDLAQHQNSPEGKVYQDLRLNQNPAISGVFMGFGCFIVLFVVAFVSVLLRTGRRLATKEGRLEFVGYRKARQLECPVCKEMIFQHEMVKHLIVDHDIEPVEAGRMTGKVMRKTWSEEE